MLSIIPKHIASEVGEDFRKQLLFIAGHTSEKPYRSVYPIYYYLIIII